MSDLPEGFIPPDMSMGAGPPVNDRDALAVEREELRQLVMAFMRLTPTRKEHIAHLLDVDEGLEELRITSVTMGIEILRRVRAGNKFNELKALVQPSAATSNE